MPTPKKRNGNIYVESCSFTLAHGATPTTCTIETEARAALQKGGVLAVNAGGSRWVGRVQDVVDRKSESGGLTSRITAVDMRDDLWNVTVFGQFNMIDRETGEVYSIFEKVDDPDEPEDAKFTSDDSVRGYILERWRNQRQDLKIRRQKLRDDLNKYRKEIRERGGDDSQVRFASMVPSKFRSSDPTGWLIQSPEGGKVSTRDLIEWLISLCGFKAIYSNEALNLINLSTEQGWRDGRYNVYNLDWNTGIKVGAAVQQVCEALGLQFTIRMDATRLLRFTRVGEHDYINLEWEALYAEESERGDAVQNVDTGVWVVGERDLYEFKRLKLVPGWNQDWNEWYFAHPKDLADALADLGLDIMTARVGEFLPDPGNLEGKKFNDLLISEYLESVPFLVYRIDGMDKILSVEEFDGSRPPRDTPISTPLLSDPGLPYKIYAHVHDPDTKLPSPNVLPELNEMETGHRLMEGTGHVVFEKPRFKYAASAASVKFDEMDPAVHIMPDDCEIDCVYYGPVFRYFHGTTERVGSKHVAGLRQSWIVESLGNDPVEHLLPGEKPSMLLAQDIATSLLSRSRVAPSGTVKYVGIAGHEPTGEIQRVIVEVSPTEGFSERVSYANDDPSPEYESQIELQRKIATTQKTKELDQLRTDRKINAKKEMLAQIGKYGRRAKNGHEFLVDATLGALNAKNTTDVKNSEQGSPEGEYEAGDPVIAVPNAQGGFDTVTEDQVQDGDKRVVGVSARTQSGWLTTITQGITRAYVLGPVAAGDNLKFDKTEWAFKKGQGSVVAQEDYATATRARKVIKLGGGGGNGFVFCRVATTGNHGLSGLSSVDGISISDGDLVLVHKQSTSPQNGVYIARSGAWEKTESPEQGTKLYIVQQGTENGRVAFMALSATTFVGLSAQWTS